MDDDEESFMRQQLEGVERRESTGTRSSRGVQFSGVSSTSPSKPPRSAHSHTMADPDGVLDSAPSRTPSASMSTSMGRASSASDLSAGADSAALSAGSVGATSQRMPASGTGARGLVRNVLAKAKEGAGKTMAHGFGKRFGRTTTEASVDRAAPAVTRAASRRAMNGAREGEGGGVEGGEEEEEDDSDEGEEMDDDEDASSDEDEGGERKPKKFVRTMPTRRAMSFKYNAEGWLEGEEDEAPRWNLVSEDGLVRKVRELRDLRGDTAAAAKAGSAPGAKARLEGGAFSELNDPLGYGPLNMAKVCLAINAGSSAPLKNMMEAERVVIYEESFEPRFYLGRIHEDTSLEELEAGLDSLKTDMANQQVQLRQLVKDNFDSFVSCKSTIEDIEGKVREMEDQNGSGTDRLLEAILATETASREAFGPLLERQEQVDRIRSVQGLLMRFRTLFNLPAVMRGFVRSGEYDRAVHEYLKAKSISLPQHSNILRRVMAEVQKVVSEFHDVLITQMEDPTTEHSQVENAIRLLLQLEPDSDPVWHYVGMQERRIRGLLAAAAVKHGERLEAMRRRRAEQRNAEERWRQIQEESNKGDEVNMSLLLGLDGLEGSGTAKAGRPAEGGRSGGEDGGVGGSAGNAEVEEDEETEDMHSRFIASLTAILRLHVPRFWRLVRAIFSGKFAGFAGAAAEKKGGKEQGSSASSSRASTPKPSASTPKGGKWPSGPDSGAGGMDGDPLAEGARSGAEKGSVYNKHSEEEAVVMLLNILNMYEAKVQSAFTVLESAPVLRPYMRMAVEQVAVASTLLSLSENAPAQGALAMKQLRVEVTNRFVSRVCLLARGTAADLASQEDWTPVPFSKRMGCPYAISSFPLRLKESLTSSLDHVTEVLARMAEEEEDQVTGASAIEASATSAAAASGTAMVGLSTGEDTEECIRSMYESVKRTFADTFFDACDALKSLSKSCIASSADGLASKGESGEGEIGEEGGAVAAAGMGEDGSTEPYVGLKAGEPVRTTEQRLLVLLANCGFTRCVLAPELADKYVHLWVNRYTCDPEHSSVSSSLFASLPPSERQRQQRQVQQQQQEVQVEELHGVVGDVEALFREVEGEVGEQYIAVKANHLGFAVIKYFLEDGTSWATAPPVRGLRDSALELMHPLVAVHAEVFVGCRPFVEKAINTLAEGLMDALQQVAYQHEDLQRLDSNAYCQLSLELDYFESVLFPFSSPALEEILLQLREMLLDRAALCIATADESSGGGGRSSGSSRNRGGDEDSQAGPRNAKELKALADTISSELLPHELQRTKLNVFCFTGATPSEFTPLHPHPHAQGYDDTLANDGAAPPTPAVYTPDSAPPLPALAASPSTGGGMRGMGGSSGGVVGERGSGGSERVSGSKSRKGEGGKKTRTMSSGRTKKSSKAAQ